MKRKKIFSIITNFYINSGLIDFEEIKEDYLNWAIKNEIKDSNELCEYLWGDIVKLLTNYSKEDIYLLTEYIREQYAFKLQPPNHHFRMIEFNEIALYMQNVLMLKKFENFRELDNKIIICMEKIKLYNLIRVNSSFKQRIDTREDLLYIFSINDEEELNSFLDNDYLDQFNYEKIEETDIDDIATNKYLKKIEILPFQIRNDLIDSLNSELGFNSTDFNQVFKYICKKARALKKMEKNTHYLGSIKSLYKDYSISEDQPIAIKSFNKVIEYFSLQRNLKNDSNPRRMELRCFNIDNEILQFGYVTAYETLTIFSNILISGHYNNELDIKTRKEFDWAQQKLTKYFSYFVANELNKNGLDLPRKTNGEFIVDIMDIGHKKGKVTFNDIDVLACNHSKRELYNIELKVYKPKINYRKMVMDSLKNKLVNSIIKREALIKENLVTIGDTFFHEDISSYKVKSIVITSRPSMISDVEHCNLKCISLLDLFNGNIQF